jgi:hypothetical protein
MLAGLSPLIAGGKGGREPFLLCMSVLVVTERARASHLRQKSLNLVGDNSHRSTTLGQEHVCRWSLFAL